MNTHGAHVFVRLFQMNMSVLSNKKPAGIWNQEKQVLVQLFAALQSDIEPP